MENIVQQCSYMYLIPVVSCSSFAPGSTRKAWSRKATCGKTGGSFEQASSLPNVFFFPDEVPSFLFRERRASLFRKQFREVQVIFVTVGIV